MKFQYAVAILAQLAFAILFRNESKAAYLLYLWSELSGKEVRLGRRRMQFENVPGHTDARSIATEAEYSLFLEP